jgi:hypothetical protein
VLGLAQLIVQVSVQLRVVHLRTPPLPYQNVVAMLG